PECTGYPRTSLVPLNIVRFVLVPVVVQRGLPLGGGHVRPDAGGVRSVSLADLVLDRSGDLHRATDMVRVDDLRLLRHRDVARGADQAAEFPESQAQPLLLVVEGLRATVGFLAHA